MVGTDRAPVVELLDEQVDHVRGKGGAPVILEYSDYECPYSRQAVRAIERVEREREERVRFAFRHYPLTQIHPHALAASAAAEALEDDDLRAYAKEIGLDLDRFDRDRAGDAVTGSVFIDGVLYQGGYQPAAFSEALTR
jgi:hypothetical protein